MDSWKDYADKIAEQYPDMDKRTIRKIAFYGLRAMYNISNVCKDVSILMMPGNHYVSFGNVNNPGRDFNERMKKVKEEVIPNKFFSVINGKVIPSWFKFPKFKKEYYASISFRQLMSLNNRGNTLKNIVMSSSLDYIRLFDGVIIKIPSPVFHGDVWKGTVSFVTYSIIESTGKPSMADYYYKYNKPQEISVSNGKKGNDKYI